MLWNARGDCLLGDFGAASFVSDGHQAQALQRIEVRAYACFLEELLEHCTVSEKSQSTIEILWELQRRCGQSESAARPVFTEISEILKGLQEIVQ
jgi:hypothetical protein